MAKIILRKNGLSVDLEPFQEDKYPYIKQYINSLQILVDQVKKVRHLDIEINLIEYGTLRKELLLDTRLDTEKIRSNVESFNSINATAIYYLGLKGFYLLEEHKDMRICYIELQQTYYINMLRIAFHEIQHFSDPFIPSEWQENLREGLTYINFEKTIMAYVRLGLNEYNANLYAFSNCLDLLKGMVGSEVEDSINETNNVALVEKIPSYLSRTGEKLNKFTEKFRSEESNDKNISNLKADLIIFLWSEFFHDIFYFLGGWKVYKDRELDVCTIQQTWDDFNVDLQKTGLSNLLFLLRDFKTLLLGDFETEQEMVTETEQIFLKYYLVGLDIDFLF